MPLYNHRNRALQYLLLVSFPALSSSFEDLLAQHGSKGVEGSCISILKPNQGSSHTNGRTEIEWKIKRRPREHGEFEVRVDGKLLATMPWSWGSEQSAQEPVHRMHLLGCPHGWHQVTVALVPLFHTSSNLTSPCLSTVRFLSVSNLASEHLPELASLRQVPQERRALLASVDASSEATETRIAAAARTLLQRCGGPRSLVPTRAPAGCEAGCRGAQCCSPLCCRLVNRCARIAAEEEASLQMEAEAMEAQHRGFLSRRHALLSAPFPVDEASATLLWLGRQYSGMEADYIELLLHGLVRSAVNVSALDIFAPNAILVLQETFPVHGKQEFWDPIAAYLRQFAERGFRVAVFLTSDEKYFAPIDWIRHTHLTIRNCWHPGLLGEDRVVAVPFGFKSGFLPHMQRYPGRRAAAANGIGGCEAWATRGWRWNFLGNANSSASRMLLIDEVAGRGGAEELGGRMVLTHTFDDALHGVRVREYAAILAGSRFTLAPEGVHVESYRLSEAVEAGSIPIVSCDAYFEGLFGDGHPLPCVHEWTWELLSVTMEAIERADRYACTIQRWWERYHRQLHDGFRSALVDPDLSWA